MKAAVGSDHARDVSRAVHAAEGDKGMVVCGSGAGGAVAARKPPRIRASVGYDTDIPAPCVRRLHRTAVMEQEGFGD